MGNFFGSSFSLRFTFATILTLPRYLTSAFAPSILLTISLAVKDIKDALSQSNLNDSELREKVSEHTAELEDMLKKEKSENKFYGLLFFLSLLFIIVFAFITYMDNEDLRNTITEKKDIITKYETITRNDTTIKYSDKEGRELTVSNLLNENLELLKIINNYEYKIHKYETYLDLIKRQYGITVIDENNSITTKGERVDSAFLLLNVYRDKLKFDPIKKHWYITNTYSVKKKEILSGSDTIRKD